MYQFDARLLCQLQMIRQRLLVVWLQRALWMRLEQQPNEIERRRRMLENARKMDRQILCRRNTEPATALIEAAIGPEGVSTSGLSCRGDGIALRSFDARPSLAL